MRGFTVRTSGHNDSWYGLGNFMMKQICLETIVNANELELLLSQAVFRNVQACATAYTYSRLPLTIWVLMQDIAMKSVCVERCVKLNSAQATDAEVVVLVDGNDGNNCAAGLLRLHCWQRQCCWAIVVCVARCWQRLCCADTTARLLRVLHSADNGYVVRWLRVLHSAECWCCGSLGSNKLKQMWNKVMCCFPAMRLAWLETQLNAMWRDVYGRANLFLLLRVHELISERFMSN